jgi:uncharacterized protein YpbB
MFCELLHPRSQMQKAYLKNTFELRFLQFIEFTQPSKAKNMRDLLLLSMSYEMSVLVVKDDRVRLLLKKK